jgi:hypothetical protein
MVLVTSEKFHWNPTSNLTCASWTRFVIFLALVASLCSQAVKQYVRAICTTRDGTYLSCLLSLTSCQQFDLLKPDKLFLFIALVAILWSGAKNILATGTTRDGTDHFWEVSLEYRQQFDLWKSYKIFSFLAMVAILCSQIERVDDMHK